MALSDATTEELLSRFDFVVQKYVPLAAELDPKIEKFGKYRKELQAIVVELQERGVNPNEPEELEELIKEELNKRGKIDDQTPDSSQTVTES